MYVFSRVTTAKSAGGGVLAGVSFFRAKKILG
jgi:hypothetical protein